MKTFSKFPGKERNQNINCPACDGHDSSFYCHQDGSRFVLCDNCKLLYQNPQPLAQDLAARYDEDYFNYETENEQAFLDLIKKSFEDIDFFTHENEIGRECGFLDIGCATGALIKWLSDRGWSAQGVEICQAAAEFARKKRNLTVHDKPLTDLRLSSESFGVVHASHVIEHLTDPKVFLKEAHRLLKVNGLLIVTTPNTQSWQFAWFKSAWRSIIADHMALFSRKNIRFLLEKSGFMPISEKTWGGLASGIGPKWVKRIVDRAAKAWGFGDVMVFLCRKVKS